MGKISEKDLNEKQEAALGRTIAFQTARKAFQTEREKEAMRHGFNDGFKEALRLVRYYTGHKITE
jgi:flagellar biosynthesis/type III secretory pathway protein FliH